MILEHLKNRPQVGIISGIGAGFIGQVQYFLTDDHVIKMVSGAAAWFGCLVAFLTLIGWSIKISDQIKARKKQQP